MNREIFPPHFDPIAEFLEQHRPGQGRMHAIGFHLSVEGLVSTDLRVVHLEGEESLSRPYRFDLDVVTSKSDLPVETLLAKSATLTLLRGSDIRKIHGVIMEVSETGEAVGDRYAYRMTLMPRIALLTLGKHNRTFGTAEAVSVLDVIESLLTEINLSSDDWEVSVLKEESYPKRDFWTQYDESDDHFFHRLLEHWGIYYYFEQQDTYEQIIFSDASTLAPEQATDAALTFEARARAVPHATGVVLDMNRRLQAVPKTVSLNDYNEATPKDIVESTRDVPNGQVGVIQEYGAYFKDKTEGDLLAQARAEELGCKRDIYELATNSPFVSPGFTFSVERHLRPNFTSKFLPVTVRHRGRQHVAGAFTHKSTESEPEYEADVTAIPNTIAYRSPRRLQRPIMAGVMPARVDATDDKTDRAMLDAEGRYKVAINFDTAGNTPYNRSSFVRMAQPYSGVQSGMHFPLLQGTEVMVGWVDGNPDRPLIMGAMPNPLTASPVTNANAIQNKIQTTSGIALIMNDGTPQPSSDNTQTNTATADSGGATAQTSQTLTTTQATTQGVYKSIGVPATGDALPHYERIGAVATDTSYETDILKDPSFKAETVEYRGTDLTDADYAGVFSYTAANRTTTTGGNETTVVNGDQRIWIGGTTSTFVASDQKDDPSWVKKLFTTATADSPYYSASVYKTPKISYYDTEYMSVYNGLTLRYALGVDLRVLFNAAGTFQHRVGASLSLSGFPSTFTSADPTKLLAYGTKPYGSSYSLSTSGYTYKQISGVDKKHLIFGTEKITLGYRGTNTGAKTMTQLTAIAENSAKWAVGGAVVAELSQALVWLDEQVGTAGQISMLAIELAAVAPITMAYVKALSQVVDYFNSKTANPLIPNQNDLDKNGEKEPTVTVAPTGVTLSAENAAVAVAAAARTVPGQAQPATIKLSVGNSAITISEQEISITAPSITINGTDTIFMKSNEDSTSIALTASTKKVVVQGNKISNVGQTTISDKLTVQAGGCAVTGKLTATTAQIG